jgi:hypothetical protein
MYQCKYRESCGGQGGHKTFEKSSKAASNMVSISVGNNTNASFYARHGRRSSLLSHPHGLKLLKFYAKNEKKPINLNPKDTDLANALAVSLAAVVREKEVQEQISTRLRTVLQESLAADSDGKFSVTGEKKESVEGTLSQSSASATGDPNAVIRMTPTPLHLSGKVEQQALVMLIIEVSVDKNDGEKKIEQACPFDYSSLIDAPNETVLLFTWNVDRIQKDKGLIIKITQEAFIYLHREKESERKMGFLWREAYEVGNESDLEFLKKSCGGIVRCLKCSEYLRTISSTTNSTSPKKWDVVSDNVAIEDDKYVFKIFDNRFHPTYCKPDAWLQQQYPWISELEVEKYLEFEESDSVIETLGKLTKKRCYGEDSRKNVSYPKGSVLVIKYKFVNGTHFASRASHFQAVAQQIASMHAAGIVHADIRGFNMLHPHPHTEPVHDGILKSRLIDFDLCGSSRIDTYPPGFASHIKDNMFSRRGRPGEIMMEEDDWCELASVMGYYTVQADPETMKDMEEYKKKEDAWETLYTLFVDPPSADPLDFSASINGFIAEHGDAEISLRKGLEIVWKKMIKGIGSANKKNQKSRGSTTIDQS